MKEDFTTRPKFEETCHSRGHCHCRAEIFHGSLLEGPVGGRRPRRYYACLASCVTAPKILVGAAFGMSASTLLKSYGKLAICQSRSGHLRRGTWSQQQQHRHQDPRPRLVSEERCAQEGAFLSSKHSAVRQRR